MKEEIVIKKKLEKGLLPYTITAEELPKSMDWKLYHGYAYSKEILPLLSGVGVTSPVLSYLYGPSIAETIPVGGLGIFGISFAVILGFLRLRAGREDLTKRILGQKKIMLQCKAIVLKIDIALQEDKTSETLKSLIELQQELITIWNNGVQEDHINPSFGAETRQKATKKCNELIRVHHPEWNYTEDEEHTSENIPDQK